MSTDTTASAPALLPCPFCGAEPSEQAIEPHTHALSVGGLRMPDHSGSHVIECGCGAGLIDDTRDAVVKRWNTRAALASQPVAQVCGACGKPWDGETCRHAENLWRHPVCYPMFVQPPNCGACPGDGSTCQRTCKLAEASPPITTSQPAAPALPPLTEEQIAAACGPVPDNTYARYLRQAFIDRFREVYERLRVTPSTPTPADAARTPGAAAAPGAEPAQG